MACELPARGTSRLFAAGRLAAALSLLLLLSTLPAAPAAAQVIPVGDLLELYTSDNSLLSLEVAGNPYGNAVAVWEKEGAGIRAQRFDQDGNLLGGTITVTGGSAEVDPAVAMDLDGRFVVVYYGGLFHCVDARWYDGSNPMTDPVAVGTLNHYLCSDPSVALGPDGGAMVVWEHGPTSNRNVYGQRLDASGTPLGDPFLVHDDTTGNQLGPQVATNLNGDFLVLWGGEGPESSTSTGLFGRLFNSSGQAVGEQFSIDDDPDHDNFDYRVAGGLDDEFVVAWAQGSSDPDVFFQKIDAGGTVLVDTTQLNTTTDGSQKWPGIAAGALDGSFAVFWQAGDGQDGDHSGIFGQWLDADGTLRGDEFQANAYSEGHQESPAAVMGADGRFLAVWSGQGPGDSGGLWAQRFLPPVTVTVNDVSIIEGTTAGAEGGADDGTEGGTEAGVAIEASALFTVTLSRAHDLGSTVTVDFVTEDDTALLLDDYQRTVGTLTFEPGEALMQSVSVPIVGDSVYEDDETFFLNLVGASEAVILGDQGQGTIIDDDAVPTLSIDDVTHDEGAEGEIRQFVFTVLLSGPIGQDVTVEFETLDDSGESGAEGGIDYEVTSGEVTIPAGTTAAHLAVEVWGDGEAEDDETFLVDLFDPTPVAIAVEQGKGTIVNDDCAIMIHPDYARIPVNGGFFVFNLSDDDGCGWTAIPSEDWIEYLTPTSGSGDATISFLVSPNPDVAQRAAEIRIEEKVFEILQDGDQGICTYSVSGGAGFGPQGGGGSVSVVPSDEDCIWIAASEEQWISLDGANTGGVVEATGTGSFAYTVGTNLDPDPRSGTIEVNGEPVAITQEGCSYTLDPDSVIDVAYSGATGMTMVVTDDVCHWSARSDDAWITVSSGSSGTGPGTVTYVVAHNLTTTPRTGSITVEDQVFGVEQDSVPCEYTLSETTAELGPDGGEGSFEVDALGGCTWNAENTASWLTITVGGSDDGVGLVEYEVEANLGTTDRSTTITVADQVHTVTQHGFLFYDAFDDGVLASDWTYTGAGSWSEAGSAMIGDGSSGKAEAFADLASADLAFAGCDVCALESTLRQTTVGGNKPKVMLHAWYQDSDNRVVVVMNEATNVWKLMQKWDGVKTLVKVHRSILPNRDYHVRVVFDGTLFALEIDGDPIATLDPIAGSAPFGTLGFKAKATRAEFGEIEIARE